MLPKKFAPVLFGLILSGLMSLLVSGVSIYRAVGFGGIHAGVWVSAWLTAWLVAFPVVLVVAPLARRTVALLVESRTRVAHPRRHFATPAGVSSRRSRAGGRW